MKRFMNKKVVAIGLTVGLVLGGAGVAYAYFTSGGSGSGTATVGTAAPFTVTLATDTPPGGGLLPGSGTETQTYTIHNGGASSERLTTVTASVADHAGGTFGGTCSGNWFTATVTGTVPGPNPQTILAGGTVTSTVTIILNESGGNQDPCQGLTTVPVTVTAA